MDNQNNAATFRADQQAQREFLEKGDNFRERILPSSLLLDKFVQTQTLGNVFRKAVRDLGQQLATDPSLKVALDHSDDLSDTSRQHEQRLAEFIESTPIAGYLRRMEPDEEKRAKALRVLLTKVTRYAEAVKRSDATNEPIRKDDNSVGRAGQVTYQFDAYLDAAATELLAAVDRQIPDSSFQNLSDLINQSQVLIESQLDSDGRFFALLNWVTDTARKVRQEGLKIFSTPESQAMLASLEQRAEQKNGLGGVILYGPPGTGKTEYLVERNKRRGFDSRVISIHHFTDFVQLVGEKPVPIGIDKDAAQLQRLQLTQETLKGMSSEDRFAYIASKRDSGVESWQLFLNAAGVGAEMSVDTIDVKVADQIVNMLLQKINATIINVGMGLEAGVSGDEAWVKGEIIQAFESGRLPILDEMDKGSSHSLEGISRLLNLSPGDTIQLGGTTYTIPHWGSVDGTANDMNLAPFLHDRFAPNVIYVDYPSPSELLLRSLVWLSDERGNLSIPQGVQEQYLGLVMYVFPQIQKLYPSKIEHPLSNRGIRKFCQMLTQNASISEALNELLLKPGALSDKELGRLEIRKILDRFPTLVTPSITRNEKPTHTGKNALRESPLYKTAQELFTTYDVNRGESGEVKINSVQLDKLERQDDKENNSSTMVARSGIALAIETKSDQVYLSSRINGRLLNKLPSNETLTLSAKETRIMGCDTTGNRIILNTNNVLTIVDVRAGKAKTEIIDTNQISTSTLTPDGQFMIRQSSNSVDLYAVDLLLGGLDSEKCKISFVDQDGDHFSPSRVQTSPDGKFLLIESKAHETHIVRLSGIPRGGGLVSLAEPFDSAGGFSIGNGNILVNRTINPSSGYILK